MIETPSTCQWPFGDPRNKCEFHFCGAGVAKRGLSYCAEHMGIAYLKRETKEERKARHKKEWNSS